MDRRKRCKLDGNYFESLFKNRVEARNLDWVNSSDYDDIYNHIDCYVNGKGVDVKGNRHLETIWLEYTNVRGKRGWLRGAAEFIAFHISELDKFSLFLRNDLLDFVLNNVDLDDVSDIKGTYLTAYSRSKYGRKDVLVKVNYNHIKHLEKGRL